MKFSKGDIKEHSFIVKETDYATFNDQVLHPVCSTYKLGQEMEWSSRLFMLDIINADEEGVGTMLHIDHKSPAYLGDVVNIRAIFDSFEQNNLMCDIEVEVDGRLIALGKTGQRLLKRVNLEKLMNPGQ